VHGSFKRGKRLQRFTCTRTRSGTLPPVEGLAGMATLQQRQRRGKKSKTRGNRKKNTQKGNASARRVTSKQRKKLLPR
jgi:hypothetical protein